MKILVIGSGGREHALCWKIRQSPLVEALYCSPGNAGIQAVAECVALASPDDITAFCKKEKIGLVVIGPEQPLVEGLADHLALAKIPVFGPSAKAARLEGSKGFTKDICKKYNIPTAAYGQFTEAATAKKYIETYGAPIVVKADGLAAGKGVVVAHTKEEALAAIDMIFSGTFGTAGSSVVIEEFLEGEEVSFFALADGNNAIEFASAQDHKAVGEGDTGPNTGGMGTYSPAPSMTDAMRKQVMDTIIFPTVEAMKNENCPFTGVLFAGLMMTADGPKLLEYNARFGDPETQVMMVRLDSDIVPLLLACAQGRLETAPRIQLHNRSAVCVVMAANGYPGAYEKGSVIKNLEPAGALPQTVIFHAGTAQQEAEIIATGGRVLGITAWDNTIASAQRRAYQAVDAIDWPGGFCRRDIAWRALKN